jgi:hypothetical protein
MPTNRHPQRIGLPEAANYCDVQIASGDQRVEVEIKDVVSVALGLLNMRLLAHSWSELNADESPRLVLNADEFPRLVDIAAHTLRCALLPEYAETLDYESTPHAQKLYDEATPTP